jgi:hypothetical protein
MVRAINDGMSAFEAKADVAGHPGISPFDPYRTLSPSPGAFI